MFLCDSHVISQENKTRTGSDRRDVLSKIVLDKCFFICYNFFAKQGGVGYLSGDRYREAIRRRSSPGRSAITKTARSLCVSHTLLYISAITLLSVPYTNYFSRYLLTSRALSAIMYILSGWPHVSYFAPLCDSHTHSVQVRDACRTWGGVDAQTTPPSFRQSAPRPWRPAPGVLGLP